MGCYVKLAWTFNDSSPLKCSSANFRAPTSNTRLMTLPPPSSVRLSFSHRGSRPLFHSSPLLSSLVTHMLPTTKVPRCLKSPALISFSEKGDPCGIRLANHCLKPLWAHRPGDKDSRELYPALAGISGCLCWDWQARLFLRWKIAGGQPTASSISISQERPEKVPPTIPRDKGMSPLSWRCAHHTAG